MGLFTKQKWLEVGDVIFFSCHQLFIEWRQQGVTLVAEVSQLPVNVGVWALAALHVSSNGHMTTLELVAVDNTTTFILQSSCSLLQVDLERELLTTQTYHTVR